MIAFVGHANDLQAWVQTLKDAGYTHIWAHMDDYGSYYVPGLRSTPRKPSAASRSRRGQPAV
jgi:hypothetical protein